ncbi:unnamed protein product [Ectocarpus sp. 4 AP-2014]
MDAFRVVLYMCLLAGVARTQELLQNCSVDTSPVTTVGSTEDAAALATSLQCWNGDFVVEWVGEVIVEETIYVVGSTSLYIAGAGPGATADGGGRTQLFHVEGGSSLHLSDVTLSSGNASASYGGAVFANRSSVSFSGNVSFISNVANFGGAILAAESNVSWAGASIQFSSNSASIDGGAIWAGRSNVSWAGGDGTLFSSNSASQGGAIAAAQHSTVSWADGATFISNMADYGGGAILAYDSSHVSFAGEGNEFISNNASASGGGAIYVSQNSTVSWADGATFISNNADFGGGAILAYDSSHVSFAGDGTEFISNNAVASGGGAIYNDNAVFGGGAILAYNYSTVSWHGDGTQFIANSADTGGAIDAGWDSIVSWNGDGSNFSYNLARTKGGAITLTTDSSVYWEGDDTTFISNNAGYRGGAISVTYASSSWYGNNTHFSSNFAGDDGGAIWAAGSALSWFGSGTDFSFNSAENGGAMYVQDPDPRDDDGFFDMSWNGSFSSNSARGSGGALALVDFGHDLGLFSGVTFINNSAGTWGGALYLNSLFDSNFTDVMFQSNWANEHGGAVMVHGSGSTTEPVVTFARCIFSDNTADGAGGAVDTVLGHQHFYSCDFEGNSAGDIGGAVRLGGIVDLVEDCLFRSNSASSGGAAVAMAEPANISGSSFDGNELHCAVGSYRKDTEEEGVARYETVCLGCPDWAECFGCTITRADIVPTCEAPLLHTTANETGLTSETLSIDGGYWRATGESDNILACYNADACRGGVTGADSFCAPGYKGPYCAVCETGYSPALAHTCTRCSSSRRQGLVAASVIAALVVAFAVATIVEFLLSTEDDEGNVGCFRRRVLRAVPVQALKIIVVVWQILTQFADAANTTYPGVYQDFISAIDVVNLDLGSVLAAGCLWSDIDFHGRLLVSTIGPLVVVGSLALTYLIAVRRNRASGNAAVVEKIRHRHQTALLLVTFLVYSSVSAIVFQTFACETLDDDVEYLRADYGIHCTDAKHKVFEVYAGIMIFVYPVGIPLLYAVLLFQRRDILASADADRALLAQSVAGLWEAYRPKRFYYEVVECGRRILLTGVVVFIFPNDAAQIAITMLTAFFFFAVFEILSPYKSESDMWLSRGGHVIVFLSMFDLLLLKVDVSGERDQSQAAFAGVLVAGHVLMVAAIVVEAFVICWVSRKNKVHEGEEASASPRVGSDDVLVFESAPASWRSFFRQRSVSEKTGPTRSISGAVVTAGGP